MKFMPSNSRQVFMPGRRQFTAGIAAWLMMNQSNAAPISEKTLSTPGSLLPLSPPGAIARRSVAGCA